MSDRNPDAAGKVGRDTAGSDTRGDADSRTEAASSEYEVIVGFAGSSRTAVEVVEARDQGEAGRLATDQHGCTAVSQEIHEL